MLFFNNKVLSDPALTSILLFYPSPTRRTSIHCIGPGRRVARGIGRIG